MQHNEVKQKPIFRGDRNLRPAEAALKIGVARQTLWAWAKAGTFPAPTRLGLRAIAWRESTIDAWQAERDKAGSPPTAAA